MIRRLLLKMRYFSGICGLALWYYWYLLVQSKRFGTIHIWIHIFFFQARLNAPSLANLRNIPSTDGNYRATRHEFWIYSLGEKRWSWMITSYGLWRFHYKVVFSLNLFIVLFFINLLWFHGEKIQHQFDEYF